MAKARRFGHQPERKRAVLAAVDRGVPVAEVAVEYNVSVASVYNWLRKRREGDPELEEEATTPLALVGAEMAARVEVMVSYLRTLPPEDRREAYGLLQDHMRRTVEEATMARIPTEYASVRGAVATVVEGLFKAIEEAVLVAVEEEVEPGMDRNRT